MSIYSNRGYLMVMRAYPEQYFNKPNRLNGQNGQIVYQHQIIYAYNQEDIQRWILFGAALAVICILIGAALMYYAKR